jgi:putative lipoprotein (rSAM/lipoprotein system)
MKFRLLIYRKILKFLALIGFVAAFNACNTNNDNIIAMYGTPAEEYNEIEFFGKVKSSDSLKPIPSVRVTLIDQYYHDSIYTTTNSAGEYTLYKTATTDKNFTIRFKITNPLQSGGNFKGRKIDFAVNFRDVNNKEKEINTDLIRQ